jgi:aminoglycoside phosphotransferase (APT) family kinase protein
MSSGDAPSADPGRDPMIAPIAAFVAREAGVAPESVRVSGLRRLAGGASRESHALDVEIERGDGRHQTLELVLRRDPPGRGDESDRGQEYRVLRAAAEAGVPVPRVHFGCGDAAVLGTPFFLMDRISGETLPRRLLRDPQYAGTRARMGGQLAEILAAIHRIPLAQPALADLVAAAPEGVSPARAQLEGAAARARELAREPHPVLDLAARWLGERVPEGARRALVHGDYRIGNVVFDERGVRAILDWELAHVGDPVEDLGWLCTRAWRFGSELPVGGVSSREVLLAGYEKAGGEAVDPAHLRFWEALGTFKVAVVFIQQADVYLSGKLPSLELASLGRRTAEAEEELVRLMQEPT